MQVPQPRACHALAAILVASQEHPIDRLGPCLPAHAKYSKAVLYGYDVQASHARPCTEDVNIIKHSECPMGHNSYTQQRGR